MDITGLGSIFDFAKGILDRVIPDPAQKAEAQLALLKLQQDGQLEQLHADTALATAQLGVDQAEAGNASTFVSGWRPFIGWICGVSLAYVGFLEPMARFVAAVNFHYTGAFPVIDTTITMQLLVGMLGLGAYRSYDKKNGT